MGGATPIIPTNPPWQIALNHPHLTGTLSLGPLRTATQEDGTTPLQFALSLTTSHPVLQALLGALAPLVAQMLPILLASLLAQASSTVPASD